MSRWMVAEQAHAPKGAGCGEDRLVVIDDEHGIRCAAVIDGATDKSGRTYAGLSGGALAAECVAATLQWLPPNTAVDRALRRNRALVRTPMSTMAAFTAIAAGSWKIPFPGKIPGSVARRRVPTFRVSVWAWRLLGPLSARRV
ncbi:hypothetical protein ACQPYK_17310 [Streptosporangium sp. CA-135522]|uniref:hypothetical protein n=1 Tax=Streptosporangium sp. CA-135522 TaxID=3240072 RepID=UPI003D8D4737